MSDFPRIDQKFGVKARDRALAGSHVSSGQNVGTGSDVRSCWKGRAGPDTGGRNVRGTSTSEELMDNGDIGGC